MIISKTIWQLILVDVFNNKLIKMVNIIKNNIQLKIINLYTDIQLRNNKN